MFVPRAFVAAMTAGQAPCVTNDLVTRAVTTTANAKTARASVRKGGMAGTVLCVSFYVIFIVCFMQRIPNNIFIYNFNWF